MALALGPHDTERARKEQYRLDLLAQAEEQRARKEREHEEFTGIAMRHPRRGGGPESMCSPVRDMEEYPPPHLPMSKQQRYAMELEEQVRTHLVLVVCAAAVTLHGCCT